MNYIVFGFEHYNPLGLVRSLGESSVFPIGVIIKSKKQITSRSKYLKKVYFVDSIEEGYEMILKTFGQSSTEKDIIFTSDDTITAYLDERYENLKNRFYLNNAGENERINFFMDKWNICDLARQVGIPVATTLTIKTADFLTGNVDISSIKYPVITKAIKSTISNWKGDSFICRNDDDLKQAFSKIRSDAVLVQQYIEKKNELCLDGCSWNKGKDVLISIASTYNYILPDTYSPLMTVKSFNDENLKNKILKMFEIIGFEGIFSIEFLIGQDDSLYFLEINFRNSTWSYASTVAGMPLPIIWAKGMKGEMVNDYKEIMEPFTAMVDLDDFRNRVRHGKPYKISFFTWFREFRNAKCKFYWNSADKQPFLAIFTNKLKRN